MINLPYRFVTITIFDNDIEVKEDKEKKQKKVLRDRPLTFCREPENETEMMELLHSKFQFETITKHRASALLRIILCVVENSKAGYKTSYSRKEGFYSGKSRAYGKAFTYRYIMDAIEHVIHTDMFIEHRAKRSSHNTEQSTLKASAKLLRLCQKVKYVEVQKDLIYVKDERDQFVTIPETEFSVQRRRDLQMINTYYEHDLKVSFDRKFETSSGSFDIDGFRVQPYTVKVHCTFNRSSWDAGGRLYSWSTNLSKKVRPHLLLNDEKCCELDFSTFHPSILFALSGKQLDRDVYDFGDFHRDLYKQAFQAMLNGQNMHRSAFSMWENNVKKFDITLPDAQSIVRTIDENTPEVKEFFFRDFGVRLQNLESRMIIEIIKRCIRQEVPVITIHDSVIVPEQHEAFARDTMKRVYSEFLAGFTCGVSKKW